MTDAHTSAARKNRVKKRGAVGFLNLPYLIWAALFIVIPVAIVAVYAFTDDSGAFTLANFQRLGAKS